MPTDGSTLKMAEKRVKLSNKTTFFQHGLFTCVHKYYTVDEWKAFAADNPDVLQNVAASSGIADHDFVR